MYTVELIRPVIVICLQLVGWSLMSLLSTYGYIRDEWFAYSLLVWRQDITIWSANIPQKKNLLAIFELLTWIDFHIIVIVLVSLFIKIFSYYQP